MPWHAGLTCEQYDAGQVERNRQEAASAEFLATKTKVCPNPRCGVHVDKYTGCDHVQCKNLAILHMLLLLIFGRFSV